MRGNETISLEFPVSLPQCAHTHTHTHTHTGSEPVSQRQSQNGRGTPELVAEVGRETELTGQDRERWKLGRLGGTCPFLSQAHRPLVLVGGGAGGRVYFPGGSWE